MADASTEQQDVKLKKEEPEVKQEQGHGAAAVKAGSQPAAVKEEAVKQEVKAEIGEGEDSGPSVDTEVVLQRLRDILPTIDLKTTSEKMLRKRLEGEFGTDFTHLKADIHKAIGAWMDEQPDVEEDEEEEEEQAAPSKKRARGGFGKSMRLSPALSEFLGVEREGRAQVVKKIWEHIKAHNLQDPSDRRKIRPDEKLKKIFPTTVTMFSMNKVLSNHFITEDGEYQEQDNEDDEEVGGSKAKGKSRGKKQKKGSDDDDDGEEEDEDDDYKAPKKAAAKRKSGGGGGGGGGGFTVPKRLSPELAEVTGQSEMSRPQLTKFFTAYFKENNLLDPKDKRKVLCNDKLKSLFGVDTFNSFGGIQKLLSPHLS